MEIKQDSPFKSVIFEEAVDNSRVKMLRKAMNTGETFIAGSRFRNKYVVNKHPEEAFIKAPKKGSKKTIVKLSEIIERFQQSTAEGLGRKNKPPFDPISKIKVERFKSILSVIVTVEHLPKNKVWPCLDISLDKNGKRGRLSSIWGFEFITVGHKDCEFIKWIVENHLLDDSLSRTIEIDIELPPSVDRLTKRAVEEDE